MARLRDALMPLVTRMIQLPLDPVLVLVPALGSFLCRDRKPFVSPERLARGLVVVLPGIEGPSMYALGVRRGLREVNAAVTIVNWAGIWPGGAAAFSRRFFQWRTELLIERIRRYRREHPGKPVIIVGHSGGAAVAIKAAEILGPGEPLTGVIALATPFRPDHDFTAALAGVTRGLVTCHSSLDLQLHLLTLLGGNFDGRNFRTAGRCGFDCRDPRLTQIAWTKSMRAAGHWGGHIGWAAAPWVREHLAPTVARWLDDPPTSPI
ncbi:MAG: alpha/beta hydrolase [Phycisphaerae bacterium]|nr:alpha/beta hydrolase [Phycisphaerae bacterium]